MVLKQYMLTKKEKEANKNLKFRTDITPIKTIVKVTALFTKFESGEITQHSPRKHIDRKLESEL